MEIKLSPLQKHVDEMIEVRICRISMAAFLRVNKLLNGKMRKKHRGYSLPKEVHDLLSLRQQLYLGVNPESIAAAVSTGGIQHSFLEA